MPEERIYRLTESQLREALAPSEEKMRAQRLEIAALRNELANLKQEKSEVPAARSRRFDIRQGILAQVVLGKPLSLREESQTGERD